MMERMPQKQHSINIIPLDGGYPWPGVATGNNASWLCLCGRERPLVGRTFSMKEVTDKSRVECPECQANYWVVPKDKDMGPVKEVRQVKNSTDIFLDFIHDRCCHDDNHTLSKSEFEHVFPGNPKAQLKKLEDFCRKKGLRFTVNKQSQTFTFTLIDQLGE